MKIIETRRAKVQSSKNNPFMINIPSEFAKQLKLEKGSMLLFALTENNQLIVEKVKEIK